MHQKLPHISILEYYQFITFRTYDSIDKFVSKIQENNNLITKSKQYQIDKYLDRSKNGAYLFEENINILRNIILDQNKILYEIDVFCIMPNHVHLLIK
ncbi:MAG: hypothetical protein RBR59_01910 [Sulfurimonadaceae bacterium]|jgi:tRNA(Leu) C34 or U34 (ribose-2'-O)-methylase TrmL|nr:hypothetical protein [Sulfurimonadaceae bacterium]